MHVEWTAGWPTARRRRVLFATGLPALACAVAGTVGPFLSSVAWLPYLLVPAAAWLFVSSAVAGRRTYRATDAGIERDWRFGTRRYPWASVRGYEVADGALAIDLTGPRPPIACATADLSDLGAVTAALDERG